MNKGTIFTILLLTVSQNLRADLLDEDSPSPSPATPSPNLNPPPLPKPTVEPKNSQKMTDFQQPAHQQQNLDSSKPITFQSEGLVGSKAQGVLVLKKNVIIEQGGFKLEADHAKVFFSNEDENTVKSVLASGRVLMTRVDEETKELTKAKGDQAEFDALKEVVTLTGHAELAKGEDIVKGNFIKYDLKTGAVKAGKVNGVLKPGP